MPTSNGHHLYFVKILQAAFQVPDRTSALKLAVEEIVALGSTPEYREGFENFQKLVKVLEDEVVSDADLRDEVAAEALEARLLDIATNSLEGTDEDKQLLLQFIEENPELKTALQVMQKRLASRLPGSPVVEIEVEKDNLSFGLYRLEAEIGRVVILGIQEGEYTVKLSTGLLLWQGKVRAEEVLWQLAYPGKKLPVAAETKMLRQQPTLVSDLLNGEGKLEVFPNLESGTIVLTFKRANGS